MYDTPSTLLPGTVPAGAAGAQEQQPHACLLLAARVGRGPMRALCARVWRAAQRPPPRGAMRRTLQACCSRSAPAS